ncbi:hypothetical protein B6V74_05865 [Thioclava sp. F42-5]|uniref:hypothetical protein n=1 Tax=unclassified Thioclava TaxID=2621713 RepID=UPI000B539523|nr:MULTISPECIES: hypothetical protein [unclassified Thioclava]OWY09546.1 hypothetical protein B6V74_05865 [Thioclava sp. F42-5]PWE51830.1 hypothetical protein DEM26_02415 [Thioclava sp. NG1]
MPRPSRSITLCAALAAAVLSTALLAPAHAQSASDAGVLKVALWGDEFYSKDPEEKANWIDQTVASMNAHDLDFTIFAGDTKSGSSECTDQAIGADVQAIFNRLDMPTLYALGDNEWVDCHRTNNGSYDPVERLSYLRKTFFAAAKSQGQNPIDVERQGTPGEAYSENSRFERDNVMFVALNVPGSNNNLVVTDKQCTKKSDRTQADCDAATAEYEARNPKNVEWLKESFAKARENNDAGILIDIQADIFFPFELSDGGYEEDFLPTLDDKNGFTDFYKTLVEETHNFEGQVLLVHGDSHYFKVDKPMIQPDGRSTANFTRVEVFGSSDNSWVEMTVDPKSDAVFSFQPVVLKQ